MTTTQPIMSARDWYLAGWFFAMECLREDDGNLPDVNSLRRNGPYRQGFRKAVEAYHVFAESFVCPRGE